MGVENDSDSFVVLEEEILFFFYLFGLSEGIPGYRGKLLSMLMLI